MKYLKTFENYSEDNTLLDINVKNLLENPNSI